ncbi:MAG: alanine racemase [Lachnospiraceae bacterium]|nr:alanine racemase [Lachnospiraceae bacterium]
MDSYARVYAEIDLDAIENNMKNMHAILDSHTQMVAVVKADGYGHGSIPIARCLESLDFMYGFATATVEEAHILRNAGITKPIIILGYSFPYAYERIAMEELRPAVFSPEDLPLLQAAAAKVGKPIHVHVKVDTGMGRIGIMPNEQGLTFIKDLKSTEGLVVEGIFTHFAKADEAEREFTCRQIALFEEFVKRAETVLGYTVPIKHCSHSAGILDWPEANYDLVRAGITMYGLYPSDQVNKEAAKLQAALSLYSHITYIKTIQPGQTVSYGGTYEAQRPTRVATVPVGYGDGYPRSLSNKGYVLIEGKRAPIIGRVCMDQLMVDVSEIPKAQVYSKVTLLGRDGQEQITAEMLGDLSGRFNYELVCDLNKRIPRVYRHRNQIVETRDCFNEI